MDHQPGPGQLGVERIAEPGSASAVRDEFARLYDASIGPLYAFVARRSPDRESAEGATVRTFERALGSIRRDGAGPRTTLGWLYRLAGHAVEPMAGGPAARLARALGRDLGTGLRRLEDQHRQIIVMRYFDGLEPADLRVTLGLSEATLTASLDAAVTAIAPTHPARARQGLEAALERFVTTRRRDEREVHSPGFAAALRERLLTRPAPATIAPSESPSIVLAPPRRSRPGARSADVRTPPPSHSGHGVPGPRWTALAVAAVLITSAVAVRGSASPAVIANLFDTNRAVVVRDGSLAPLSGGEGLLAGDVVSVRSGGHATISLGGADMRLEAGASIRVVGGSPDAIAIEQIQGRVRHRAMLTPDSRYAVTTGPLTWTVHEAVFELARESAAIDGDTVDLRVREGAVRLAGPDVAASVVAGRAATARLRDGSIDLATGDIERLEAPSPWLAEPSEAAES